MNKCIIVRSFTSSDVEKTRLAKTVFSSQAEENYDDLYNAAYAS